MEGHKEKSEQPSLFESPAPATEEKPKDAVVITGSRDIERDPARTLFEKHLRSWVGNGYTWLLGGALGVDSWALEWLSENGESCWVVVPFTAKEQPKFAQGLFDKAKKIIELGLPQSKQAYLTRNRYMVDRSRAVIGFWSGKPGGTSYTLEYGLHEAKEVHAYPVTKVKNAEGF